MTPPPRDHHAFLGIGGGLLMTLGWLVFFAALLLLWAVPGVRGPSSVYVLVAAFAVLGAGALLQGLGFVNQTARYGPFAGYAGMIGFIVALSAAFLATSAASPSDAGSLGELGLRLFPFSVVLQNVAGALVPLLATNLPSRERPAILQTSVAAFVAAGLWLLVTILLLVGGPLGLGSFGMVALLAASALGAVASAALARFLLRTRHVEPAPPAADETD